MRRFYKVTTCAIKEILFGEHPWAEELFERLFISLKVLFIFGILLRMRGGFSFGPHGTESFTNLQSIFFWVNGRRLH